MNINTKKNNEEDEEELALKLKEKQLKKELKKEQKKQTKRNIQIEARQKIELNEDDFEWQYVKGWGKGGQKVNKTNNCAVLRHKPTGIQVKSHASRDLITNKHMCIKKLKEELDLIVNKENSKKSMKINKKQKQKAKAKKRSMEKYNTNQSKQEELNENNQTENCEQTGKLEGGK